MICFEHQVSLFDHYDLLGSSLFDIQLLEEKTTKKSDFIITENYRVGLGEYV